jgi:hypothetical protein
MVDFTFLSNAPHITYTPEDPKVSQSDVYYCKEMGLYMIFEVSAKEDEATGKAAKNFREMREYMEETADRGKEDLCFNYPTTWSSEKIHNLLQLIKAPPRERDLDRMLLMLI